MDTREVGRTGEELAEKYLQKEGYKVREKNFWCRFGEIDLIAVDGDYIVFIEVKTARNKSFSPQENITAQKRARIIKVANYYRANVNFKENYRFDAIIVQIKKEKPEFDLIKNAFHT